jgi:predicted transcriptional regulator
MGCLKRFRPEGAGSASVFGPLENALMNALWDLAAPATVGDVVERLRSQGLDVHYSSAKTTLNTLAAKGCVTKAPRGRANVFAAGLSRFDFEAQVVRRVFGALLRDYRTPLLTYVAEQLAEDRALREELNRLIQERLRHPISRLSA